MNEQWERVIKKSFTGGTTDAGDEACEAALNLFMGDAAHHEQFWKEQLIEALGITREELCRALYGWNPENWPDKGIAP